MELITPLGFNDEGKAKRFEQIKLRYQLGVFGGKMMMTYQIFAKRDEAYVALTSTDQKLEFPVADLNKLAFVFINGQITLRIVS